MAHQVGDSTAATPARQAAQCPDNVQLANGSFEQPVVARLNQAVDASTVPGWRTTASDNQIELWRTGFDGGSGPVTAADGNQLAELNANEVSTLYQDLPTTPGQRLVWQLSHRGRRGDDTMQLRIGPAAGALVAQTPIGATGPDITDPSSRWGVHRGVYLVPAGQTTTRFAFASVSAAGGDNSVGNLLDDIRFGTPGCLVPSKSVVNDQGHDPAQIGDTLTYTVSAKNEGTDEAYGASVLDAVPAGTDFVPGSITRSLASGQEAVPDAQGYDAASGLKVAVGDVGAGATVTVRFKVKVRPDVAPGSVISNIATVSYQDLPSSPVTKTDTPVVTTPVGEATLAVTKTVDNPRPKPGRNVVYTVTVTNTGPNVAGAVQVKDKLPAGLTYVSDDSAGAYAPATGIWSVGELPVKQTRTLKITARVDSTQPVRNYADASTSTPTRSPVCSNPKDTGTCPGVEITPKVSSLAIVKSASLGQYVPGEPLAYTIKVTNGGPEPANRVAVRDVLPDSLGSASWTCSASAGSACGAATGSGNLDTTADVAVNGTVTYTYTGTVASSANQALSNTATVTPAADSDTFDLNCSPSCGAVAVTPLGTPKTSVTITKSAPDKYTPGKALSYTVEVRNAGPSDAAAVKVVDVLPGPLKAFTWTCAATAPSGCSTVSGTGDIGTTVYLASGGKATFTVTGTVPVDTRGNLVNTATATPPAGTADAGCTPNCSASATSTPNASALGIVKLASLPKYVPGTALAYTITVTNDGPEAAKGATVRDVLPEVYAGAEWTCSASVGSACGKASGSGNLDTTADVAAKGTVTYTYTGTVLSSAKEVVSNKATVTPATGTDTVDLTCAPSCSSAVDTPLGAPKTSIKIVKSGPKTYAAGDLVGYTVEVSNAGPSDAAGVKVADVLPAALKALAWTCVAVAPDTCSTASGTGDIDTTVSVANGGKVTFTVGGTIPAGTTGDLVNVATATPPAGADDAGCAPNCSSSVTSAETRNVPAAAITQALAATGVSLRGTLLAGLGLLAAGSSLLAGRALAGRRRRQD